MTVLCKENTEGNRKMKCSRCGKENSDYVDFCVHCGEPTSKYICDLVHRAQSKEQQALSEIYSSTYSTVYRVINTLIKEDTVYDILQDTYVKAFTSIEQLQNPEKLLPWLKMIATNKSKDWLKKKKPLFFTEMDSTEETDGISFEEAIEDERKENHPEIVIDENEVSRIVKIILDQLPEDQRLVIGMYYYEEISVKDIATALEVSENTVKSRLVYGRKKIKESVLELEKQGTKLYTLAPIPFFLLLLEKTEKVSAAQPDAAMLKQILKVYTKKMINTGAKAANPVSEPEIRMTDSTVPKAASKGVRMAAGKAVKHATVKTVAYILAGACAVGGITYGVFRYTGKRPFYKENIQAEQITEETEKQPKLSITPLAGLDLTPTEKPAATPEPTMDPEEESRKKREREIAEVAGKEEEIYRSFYEKYIQDEELKVVPAVYQTNFDDTTGLEKDLLLGACMKDFGGDGLQELLLIRTKSKADDSQIPVRALWLQLYTIKDNQAVLSSEMEVPNSDLNSGVPNDIEEIGMVEKESVVYLYRYGMYHPGAGAGEYMNLVVRTTDMELQREYELDLYDPAEGGWYFLDGEQVLAGDNPWEDREKIENTLKKYDMDLEQELTIPCILKFTRMTPYSDNLRKDTFNVQNCFEAYEAVEELSDDMGEGIQDIQGTWYTNGSAPYNLRMVFTGKHLDVYSPHTGEVWYTAEVTDVVPTDYGYFFRMEMNEGNIYGYRLDTEYPDQLTFVDNGDPYSMDGYSGSDSLRRTQFEED